MGFLRDRCLPGVSLLLCLLSAWLAWGSQGASASNLGPGGARVRVGDEMLGPYRVLLTTAPDPAPTGKLTIVAQLTDPASGKAVRDARIMAELIAADGTKISAPLTHENAGNPTEYAAHIDIAQAGDYNVTVRIAAPAGPAEVSFVQTVSEPRAASTLLLAGLPFLVVLGILAAIWFARAGGRAEQAEA